MTICFAPFSLTRHVNRMVVGGKAGTGWWGWYGGRGGGGAAAVCRLLEDCASPSHLLITVVSETQQANNCSAAAACWRDSAEHEQMEGRARTSQRRSQTEQIGGSTRPSLTIWANMKSAARAHEYAPALFFIITPATLHPVPRHSWFVRTFVSIINSERPPLVTTLSQSQQHSGLLVEKVHNVLLDAHQNKNRY